ncbi:siderophore biosynthesis protein [Legionella norrlandica]|uniref:Siderophore biosynthesis protein n=1 Tax=Legionella norrlandica TaxID=1498499 RepID=A0A0A2SUB2_9GAMM|nr:IucA/IucC family protein [Legionella norrlandica]KGP64332.1 siderophore biosynthesis protein [Legionella norrlandica]
MALAYGNFHELSHQLRFLLFEIGIGLPQNSIDYFITLAHKNTLERLQQTALAEKLISSTIASHHIHDFIDQLQIRLKNSMPESQFFQWNKIRKELDESIANEALAQAYKQNWNIQLRNEATQYNNFWDWVNHELSSYQSLLFLEQWGCVGHPYHPAFRAKMGFTRREVLQNSPEFQAKISVHWCALSKVKAESKHFIDYIRLIAQEFPIEYLYWREKLLFGHFNPDDYFPIPVHPWQWRNQLQIAFAPLIDNKSLILLPHHQTLIPSLTHNMMMPQSSTLYTLKLETTLNSSFMEQEDYSDYMASLTGWVDSLLDRTNHYKNTLFISKNIVNINIPQDTPKHEQKNLAVGLHQNPIHLITQGQRAVPLSSLFAISPCTKVPLIIEIIQASGLQPMTYFAQYCYKLLFGQFHLLLKYGVALKIEQQNVLVIFEQNMPQGIVIKNLSHLQICHHELFKDIQKPNVPEPLAIYTKDLNHLRALIVQGTLKNNLYHWIQCLNSNYHILEKKLWSVVRGVIQSVFQDLSKDKAIDLRLLSWQQHLMLYEDWEYQPLFTLCLNPNTSTMIKQANPLCSQ